mgnify:CR=1 FL=1
MRYDKTWHSAIGNHASLLLLPVLSLILITAIRNIIITGPTSLVRPKAVRQNNLSASVKSDRWLSSTYLIEEATFVGIHQWGLLEKLNVLGLAGAGARVLLNCQPDLFVLIGCDHSAFARDAALLAKAGMRLERLVVVDLFPGTSHVETVGAFLRD